MNNQAKAWADWRQSAMGKKCADFSTCPSQDFLQNRLWQAFMAGYEAAEKAQRSDSASDAR